MNGSESISPAAVWAAILWMLALAAMCLIRLMRAPSVMDRIMAVDFLNLLVVGVLLLAARLERSAHYLDTALILTLLSFAGTLAAVRYLMEGRLFCGGGLWIAAALWPLRGWSEPGFAAGGIETISGGAATAAMVIALILFASGAVGMLRLPDFFTRVHAASNGGLIGVLLLALSLAEAGKGEILFRIVLILLFLIATTPVSTHALLQAAVLRGEAMMPETVNEMGNRRN